MAKVPISVVIPAFNEAEDIGRTLKTLSFADEIIIQLDDRSTDDTERIAKKFGCKVFVDKMVDFCTLRNAGTNLARNDWVLSLEADVIISEKLAQEIRQAIQNDKCAAYRIGRINEIWGKPIMHTDWGPKEDTHIWLYRKDAGMWVGSIHEEFVTNKPVGTLKNYLYHYNYKFVGEFIDKINSISDKGVQRGVKVGFFSPLYDFCKRYFYKLGFLDGYHGLFLSYLQAIYYLTLQIKTRTKVYTLAK